MIPASFVQRDFIPAEGEFGEMRELVRKASFHNPLPQTWRLAQHENWYYASLYLEEPEYFARRARLWRDEMGTLRAFCLRYYDTLHMVLDPEADAERRGSGVQRSQRREIAGIGTEISQKVGHK